MNTPEVIDAPVWRLEEIYCSYQDERYGSDLERLATRPGEILQTLGPDWPGDGSQALEVFERTLQEIERLGDVAETLQSYTYLRYSVETANEEAVRQLNLVEQKILPLKRLMVRLRRLLASGRVDWRPWLERSDYLRSRRFVLEEMESQGRHEMSEELEELAADLNRAGGDAWGRLQETLTSHLSTEWDSGTRERKTLVQLRHLASDPDRSVRQRAWRLELDLLKTHEIALAAALNGVKGFTTVLNSRRGWGSTRERSIFQSRIQPATLEALITSLEEGLGIFHRYLKIKARLLGVSTCAFYDLFAPVGTLSRKFSWGETQEFLLRQFASFSTDLKDFARRALEGGWVHARIQEGKVGGAYCISLPLRGESRVLCNFDGTFGEVKTLAHELGHAYHFEILKDSGHWLRQYPMTLAETASTFAETLVFEAAYREASGEEALHLLENQLQDICQVCVDILSRYHFELKVLELRPQGELSAAQFCEIMTEAQKRTYGPALDPTQLHPYMWAVKGHYYITELAFYNFPYAFGQLLSLSLYHMFQEEGPGFAERYRRFLARSGSCSCEEAVAELGEDITSPRFWQKGLRMVEKLVDELEELAT